MEHPTTLLTAVVTALRAIPELVTAAGNSANIVGVELEYPQINDLERYIQEMKPPGIAVFWMGYRTGNFGRNEAIKHDFRVALRPLGKYANAAYYLREGMPTTGGGRKFKYFQVTAGVFPPEAMQVQVRTFVPAQDTFLDYMEASFTLTERGADV